MIIKIDFNSDEAIYMQITNQIIMGIAKRQICDGDQLPSIRNMADEIGINMHTVNKAYTVLRQAGYVKLDRRRGAVVSVDVDKIEAIEHLVKEYKDHTFVIPVHPNPNVKDKIHSRLRNYSNVKLLKPLDYPYLVYLMKNAKLILTDSGGIQEEAPSFGCPTLVMRLEKHLFPGRK